ncbi:MAG: DUF6267 family protein [Desulfuromonadaceae bacterium]
MIRFKQYLKEAQQVVGVSKGHMTHVEDLVFDLGVEGTRLAINFLRDVRDMLSQGSGNKSTVASVKFDGSPALIAGINPENGKFFVAKKSIFNKNPKLYYSHADIEADTSGDLAHKLKVAFDECKKLGMTGVYQGDIMFTADSLKYEMINGTKHITFHPNTIVYAVEADSPLGKKIAKSNIGIVWHTTYEGNTIADLKPTFGKDIASGFIKTRTAWMEDATYKDVTGQATFTDSERKNFDALMSDIGRKFQRMPSAVVNAIHKDPTLLMLVHTYNNSKIRAGQKVADVAAHVDGLYHFIFDRYEKEIVGLKSSAAKERKSEARSKVLNFFSLHPKSELIAVFELSQKIAEAKAVVIAKMNRASNIETLLKTNTGFQVTGAEGFVAISERGAVKLVDRLEFSKANFSADFKKGWNK